MTAVPPKLNINKRGVSALSLKSLDEKNKIKEQENQKEALQNLAKDAFTPQDFLKVWHNYLNVLETGGEKLMLSILKAEKPTIKEEVIELVFPNNVMLLSFNKGKTKLIKYLRQELNNFNISINTIVNEATAKEYIYTSQEKYKALKKKNPQIELLKKTFKLDL